MRACVCMCVRACACVRAASCSDVGDHCSPLFPGFFLYDIDLTDMYELAMSSQPCTRGLPPPLAPSISPVRVGGYDVLKYVLSRAPSHVILADGVRKCE